MALSAPPAPLAAQSAPPAVFAEPSHSPEGAKVASVSGGDIWVAPAIGGGARLLVGHTAYGHRRLTCDDAAEQLDGRSADSEWIYFSFSSRDIAGMNDVHRIRDAEGKEMELIPRQVDVRVDRPMGESYRGADIQVDAAVRALRERIR